MGLNEISLYEESFMEEKTQDLQNKEELIASAREFVHDISNQLLISHGMSTFVLSSLKSHKDVDKKCIEKLEKSITAMDKILQNIKEYRELLLENS